MLPFHYIIIKAKGKGKGRERNHPRRPSDRKEMDAAVTFNLIKHKA